MIGTELQRAIDRHARTIARAARFAPMNRQVGTLRDAFLVGASPSFLVEGITSDPFWVQSDQCSSEFISAAMTLGRAVIGRSVMVTFAGRQPFIAYLIGA